MGYPAEGKFRYVRSFYYDNRVYNVTCVANAIPVTPAIVNQAIEMAKETKTITLFYCDCILLPGIMETINQNPQYIRIISYRDSEELKQKTQALLTGIAE
jgi:hypothetical protein